jgi:arylsulfatase A-like enzyme
MNKTRLLALASVLALPVAAPAEERPNILWIVQEDTSPWMSCYGHALNDGWTPVIDKLAASGVRFARAYTPTPVCSTCRSSFIVGANAIRFGAHEHRSRRGKAAKPLPEGMKTLPALLRDAGYFTFNQGKSDYNFTEADTYAKISKKNARTPWRDVPEGQPFFGQIQTKGGKLNVGKRPKDKCVDPEKVTVPADYPQNQLYREVVAEHYDSIRGDDENIGRILDALEADGLLDTTIVAYFSDHGANNLVRHKQMATEAGLHVPFIVTGPESHVPSGQVRDDLVSILDLTATTAAWAGIPKPKWFEGHDLFAKDHQPREFAASARDRCDHTIERVRSIRTDRFRYTRNFFLDRVFLQPQYRDKRPFLVHLTEAYANGTLDPKLTKIYYGERPAEELYDITKDPAQMHNLAGDPKHAKELAAHRTLMDRWLAKGDEGAKQEPDIELEMNGWAHWGKGVNPEYERISEDSDGDGLSDRFETITGRDPKDGRLVFTFDCGGWQTEGWTGSAHLGNIAGFQGFLDFDLRKGKGTIVRNGLKLDTSKNAGPLTVRIRATESTALTITADGKELWTNIVKGGNRFRTIPFTLPPEAWKGTVSSLALSFSSSNGAAIEIDSIECAAK